jgi:hypothetical protein
MAITQTVPGAEKPISYQQITSLSSAASLTVPSGARYAKMIPEAQAVRWRADGTNPEAGVGMPLAVGAELVFAGPLASFKVIEQTGSAKLNVYYYG